ncbi:MAG: potassium channel family protein [Verrucomicrobiae bacterium]|nr:potassium channel family protein [Verrucomicrobiae bacterium]NNJ42666.1 two pore domain potassium channel family protein [Akkermansiaceae bacterium]
MRNQKTNDFKRDEPRYYPLGIALLSLALFYPILEFAYTGLIIWTSVFWGMLLTATHCTSYKPFVKKITHFLSLIVILVGIAGLICYNFLSDSHSWIFTSINALTLIFLAFITASLLYSILSSSNIGINNLIGAASAYVLIGVTFAYSYIVLHSVTGEALLISETLLPGTASNSVASLVADYCYFSFTTLTTLGFGDLSPRTLPVRVLSCAEAIIGQLFLTILVARLVGLHVLLASGKSGEGNTSHSEINK